MFSQLFSHPFRRKHCDDLGNCVLLPIGLPKKSALNVVVTWLRPLGLSEHASDKRLPHRQGWPSLADLFLAPNHPRKDSYYLLHMLPYYVFFHPLERHLMKSEGSELQPQLCHLLPCDP